MSSNWNVAERQQKYFRGELTLEECKRLGNTHAHYQWARSPGAPFNAEQMAAYNEGFDMYPETFTMDNKPDTKDGDTQ